MEVILGAILFVAVLPLVAIIAVEFCKTCWVMVSGIWDGIVEMRRSGIEAARQRQAKAEQQLRDNSKL
jgi:hypothetical protein